MRIKSFLSFLFEKISSTNVAMLVFLAFAMRLIVLGASWGDAIAMIAISALFGYDKFLKTKGELRIAQGIKDDLNRIKNYLVAKEKIKVTPDEKTKIW